MRVIAAAATTGRHKCSARSFRRIIRGQSELQSPATGHRTKSHGQLERCILISDILPVHSHAASPGIEVSTLLEHRTGRSPIILLTTVLGENES
jgi:hypothetical protein